MFRLTTAFLALAFVASSKPTKRWNPAGYDTESALQIGPDNADCSRETYTITATSQNMDFKVAEETITQPFLASQFQDFVSSLPSYSNYTDDYISGMKSVTRDYKISGTLCKPKNYNGRSPSTIQLCLHGIGFDSSYWNFRGQGVSEDYSYIRTAAASGATTFRYDRLGTGLSEHPADTYNIVQAPTDLAILTEIVRKLRAGEIGGTAFNEIIAVGHSYGSVQTNALTAQDPAAINGAVLTGFSANTSAVQLYLSSAAYTTATKIFPERFSADELDDGYLVTANAQQNALNFLYRTGYTAAAADLARATEQPVTPGVLFTFGGLPGPAPEFTGKVHVVTGDKDWIFCLRNCYASPPGGRPSILDYVEDLYPANSGFSTYIPANTGHANAVHTSAPEANREIQQWIGNNYS